MKMKMKSAVLLAILLSPGISPCSDYPTDYGTDTAAEEALQAMGEMGLSDEDYKVITEMVIEYDIEPTYENIRDDGGVSEEGLEQIQDDARTN